MIIEPTELVVGVIDEVDLSWASIAEDAAADCAERAFTGIDWSGGTLLIAAAMSYHPTSIAFYRPWSGASRS